MEVRTVCTFATSEPINRDAVQVRKRSPLMRPSVMGIAYVDDVHRAVQQTVTPSGVTVCRPSLRRASPPARRARLTAGDCGTSLRPDQANEPLSG